MLFNLFYYFLLTITIILISYRLLYLFMEANIIFQYTFNYDNLLSSEKYNKNIKLKGYYNHFKLIDRLLIIITILLFIYKVF